MKNFIVRRIDRGSDLSTKVSRIPDRVRGSDRVDRFLESNESMSQIHFTL